MNTWGTLYRWELKKIMRKRFTIAALAAVYAFIAIGIATNFVGTVYIEDAVLMPQADYFALTRKHALALSGRALDDGLIAETLDAYEQYASLLEEANRRPDEARRRQLADTYLRIFMPYHSAFEYMQKMTGFSGGELRAARPDETALYAQRLNILKKHFRDYRLTQEEAAYWLAHYRELPRPTPLRYCSAYINLISTVYALSALLIMLIGVSLSGIFSEDRASRCDALILSSRNGRGILYTAKVAAGLTFSLGAAVGLCIVVAMPILIGYGAEGFSAPVQLYKPFYPYPISVGRFTLLAFGLMLIVTLFMSLLTILLSACFARPLIPMSLVTVCVIAGMFLTVPEGHRALSQVWDWLPTNYLFVSHMFDLRLLSLFGQLFLSWQILPAVYAAAGIGVFFCGLRKYMRQQVGAR